MESNNDSWHCNTMKLCNMSDTINKMLITQHSLNNKKKHNLSSLSFLFNKRKLNTNLSFISDDFTFSGQLLNCNYTHTSSNVTVSNINKKNKTCCLRVLSKTLTRFYFRSFFLSRVPLTKQHFISGLVVTSISKQPQTLTFMLS